MRLPGFGKGGPLKPGLAGFADKLLDPLGIMPSGVKKIVAPGQQQTLEAISPSPKPTAAAKSVLAEPSPAEKLDRKQRAALLVDER